MTPNHDFLDNLANDSHQKMLREIANDKLTPKKSDKLKETERPNDTFCECKMIEDKCTKRVLLGRLAKGLSDLLLVVRVHQYG